MNFFLVNFFLVNYCLVIFGIVTDRQTDRLTDGKRRIRAHRALAQVGSKKDRKHLTKFSTSDVIVKRIHMTWNRINVVHGFCIFSPGQTIGNINFCEVGINGTIFLKRVQGSLMTDWLCWDLLKTHGTYKQFVGTAIDIAQQHDLIMDIEHDAIIQ